MTPREIKLLRTIGRRQGVVTFVPSAATATAAGKFDRLVAALFTLQRCGWIELELCRAGRQQGGYRQKYSGAAARCTEQRKRALEMFGV